MLFHIFGFILFDDWYNSPFIVPVAACIMLASISVARIWSGVRNREIKSAERLAMIAQGLQPEPEWDQEAMRQAATAQTSAGPKPVARPNDGAGARRAGLILCSIGAGLIVFFAFLAIVLRERDVFSGACSGIIPLAIGVGFLIDAGHRRRDYEHWMDTVQPGVSAFGAGQADAMTPPPPPPPPVGLTPAQASDWRPLH